MLSQKFTIQNEAGLHARPASVLSKAATQFSSDIKLHANGKVIETKSVLSIMAAAVKFGTEVELVVTGDDEEAAMAKISELFQNGFGE